MQIRTFAASTTAKLDRKVNGFLARHDIEIRRIHPTMSIGTYMVVVEYEEPSSTGRHPGTAHRSDDTRIGHA